jgi:hypothetical protein
MVIINRHVACFRCLAAAGQPSFAFGAPLEKGVYPQIQVPCGTSGPARGWLNDGLFKPYY